MTESQDDSEILNSRTGAGLMKFYELKIRKYELVEGVVNPIRTASKRILEVEDDPDSVDLTTLDVDNLAQRFKIKNRAELTDKSFAAYESRFRRGLSMYLRWLDQDPNWMGKTRSGSTTKVSTTAKTENSTVPVEQANNRASVNDAVTASATRVQSELLNYPVALIDSNVTAILQLPRKYTTSDAARMAALINALAVPDSASPSNES